MADTTASDILSYRGDAAAGIGADAGALGVVGIADTSGLNDILKTLQSQNHQNQIIRFNQAVQDRDKSLQALAAGAISTGQLRKEDRDTVEKKKKEYYDIWRESKGNIFNPDVYMKLKEKEGELKDYAIQGQQRYIDELKIKQEGAKITNPYLRKKFEDNLSQQQQKINSDFFATYDPYVAPFTADFNDAQGYAISEASTIQDPNDKLYNITTTTYNPQKSILKAEDRYVGDVKARASMDDIFYNVQQSPQLIKKANDALQIIADKQGVNPADFLINVQPDGMIAESVPSVIAKLELAGKGYIAPQRVYNDKLADDLRLAEKDKNDLGVKWYDAKTRRMKAATADRYAKWKTENPQAAIDTETIYNNINNKIKFDFKSIGEGGKFDINGRVYVDEIPDGYRTIGGIVPVMKSVKKMVNGREVSELEPTNQYTSGEVRPKKDSKTGRLYWDVGFTDGANGKAASGAYISDLYKKAKQRGESFESFIKRAIQLGAINTEYLGADGSATNKHAIGESIVLKTNTVNSKGETPLDGVILNSGGSEGESGSNSNSSSNNQ